MRRYLTTNLEQLKAHKKQYRRYELAAKLAIKYGSACNNDDGLYTDRQIGEFWKLKAIAPTPASLRHQAQVQQVKWFIVNHLMYDDGVWNGDFLHGIATVGSLEIHKHRYPSLIWFANNAVEDLVNMSPFGGTKNRNFAHHDKTQRHIWSYVPAFYLKHSKDSIRFMAGVFATGQLFTPDEEKKIFVKYNGGTIKYIKEYGIPIEYENSSYVLISPIWPALFANYMPKKLGKQWLRLNGEKTELYAALLWKTFVGNDFKSKAIPYLKSRRWVFYAFRKETNGKTLKYLKDLILRYGIPSLDRRIRKVVQEASANNIT